MAKTSLAPGFRFHPTDAELVLYYLKRKIMGKRLLANAVSEVDIYKFAPWDLRDMSCIQSRDLEWYFFCPRDKKYANGLRTNRATEIGYWKTTGKDRTVCNNSRTVGMKKTLVFHIGRAPCGDRTNWVMHEYRLDDKQLAGSDFSPDAFVLCKVFEKSGPGPKNGEQYGAPFREDEWDEFDDDFLVTIPSSSKQLDEQHEMPPSHGHAISGDTNVLNHFNDTLNTARLIMQLQPNNYIAPELRGSTNEMPSSPLPAEDPAGIFTALEDLPQHSEMYSVDNMYLPYQSETEFELQQALMGFDDEPFLELMDFSIPIEKDGSELLIPNNTISSNAATYNDVVPILPTLDPDTAASVVDYSKIKQ